MELYSRYKDSTIEEDADQPFFSGYENLEKNKNLASHRPGVVSFTPNSTIKPNSPIATKTKPP